jgi:hypothetical protein
MSKLSLRDRTRRLVASASTFKKETASVRFILKDLTGNSKDATKVKIKLDSILQLQSELHSTLSMVKSGTEASMIYKIANLGTSKVSPSQVAKMLRSYIDSGAPDVKKALAVLGAVKMSKNGCCTLTTDSKDVVDKSDSAIAAKNAAASQQVTVSGPLTVQGSVELAMTLPSGVTADTFVQDATAKQGIEAGIASKLAVPASWVSATLSVKTGGRRLSTSATIKVDFTVTIPSTQNAGTAKSSTDILAAIDDADSNALSKTAWASSITTALNQATSATYAATVSAVQKGSTSTTTTATATNAPGATSSAATMMTSTTIFVVTAAIMAGN